MTPTVRAFVMLALSILPAWPAFGQPTASPPEFEVADIKLSTSKAPMPQKGGFLPGGRVELPNLSLRELIMAAYGVPRDLITGGPNWVDSDRFDIVAKAAVDTPGPALLLMLQSLLADRFKLAFHRQEKTVPVYALVVRKGGLKLRQSAAFVQPTCIWHTTDQSLYQRECHNMTMAGLARELSGYSVDGIDRPVVDLTELKGEFDFQFAFDPRNRVRRAAGRVGEGGDSASGVGAAMDSLGPTIFDAMAHIGLELKRDNRPLPAIVIDQAERPEEN